MASFMVSAPGKVIVFGEHAVVHGRAAIAAAISLRSYLLVTKDAESTSDISLTFPDIDFSHAWPVESLPWEVFKRPVGPRNLDEPVTQLDTTLTAALNSHLEPISPNALPKQRAIHIAAAKAFLYILLSICNGDPPPAHIFTMRSTIPIGAGLGSSASISVCIATVALRLMGRLQGPGGSPEEAVKEKEVINHWAYVGEMVMHGTPSGVDNTVATLGNAVHFRRASPSTPPTITPIPTFPTLPLLVINTRQSRSTAHEVAKVKTYLEKHPAIVNNILDAIDCITEAAHALINDAQQDILVPELGALIRTNHALLSSLGVSHPKLERIRQLVDFHVSTRDGVDGEEKGYTKLTGGGGGGCAITLLPSTEGIQALKKTLEEEGFEVHETLLGSKGVGLSMSKGVETLKGEEFLKVDLQRGVGSWEWKYWS